MQNVCCVKEGMWEVCDIKVCNFKIKSNKVLTYMNVHSIIHFFIVS